MAETTQPQTARLYYDQRFAAGYADYWPTSRYERIAGLLKALPLPQRGFALDFGCGNGSFSQLIADTLTGWTVIGADVSDVALTNSTRLRQGPTFINVDRLTSLGQKFDLIFSHHVLEHVPDLDRTWEMFDLIAAPDATILHVLPCGNPGSLEHALTVLRRDGIDPAREGRFFCDDEPHVRRANTDQMRNLAQAHGFSLTDARYSQHFWSQLWPYAYKGPAELRELTDTGQAVSRTAALKLLAYRSLFVSLSLASRPTFYRWQLKPRETRTASDHARHALALLLSPLSTPSTRLLRYLDEREWRTRCRDARGAEMYLTFRRAIRASSAMRS